jgi:hypothetical protein
MLSDLEKRFVRFLKGQSHEKVHEFMIRDVSFCRPFKRYDLSNRWACDVKPVFLICRILWRSGELYSEPPQHAVKLSL